MHVCAHVCVDLITIKAEMKKQCQSESLRLIRFYVVYSPLLFFNYLFPLLFSRLVDVVILRPLLSASLPPGCNYRPGEPPCLALHTHTQTRWMHAVPPMSFLFMLVCSPVILIILCMHFFCVCLGFFCTSRSESFPIFQLV